MSAIYIESKIDGKSYCKTNGHFTRHLREHGIRRARRTLIRAAIQYALVNLCRIQYRTGPMNNDSRYQIFNEDFSVWET